MFNTSQTTDIHNLANLELDEEEKYVLLKDLKFIPTPPPASFESIEKDLNEFVRNNIILKHFFGDKAKDREHTIDLPRKKSNWTPSTEVHEDIKRYAEETRKELKIEYEKTKNQRKRAYHHHVNLTEKQKAVLKKLKTNQTIIIKPADKNLGLVIMKKEWYISEVNRQLSDTQTYKPTTNEDVDKIIQEVQEYLLFIKDRMKWKATNKTWKFLKDFSWTTENGQGHKKNTIRVPNFYIIPKIHKPVLKGRPIVAGHSWVTTPSSILLDKLLQPLLDYFPHILKDTLSLLRTLESIEFPQHCTLITSDITDLYTSIELKDCEETILEWMRQSPNPFVKNLVPLAFKLIRIVFYHNVIHFMGKYYIQVRGIAMGTPAAVVIANLYLAIKEYNIIKTYKEKNVIFLYKRLVDDILIIGNINKRNEIEKLKYELNNLHKNLEMTFKEDNNKQDYLDLCIYKGKRFLEKSLMDTKTFQKPINKYLYIPFDSFHPLHNKTGLINTELQRYVKTCSDEQQYERMKLLFLHRLKNRGYPHDFLVKEFRKIKYKSRETFLWRGIDKNKFHSEHTTNTTRRLQAINDCILRQDSKKQADNKDAENEHPEETPRRMFYKIKHNITYMNVKIKNIIIKHWSVLKHSKDMKIRNMFQQEPQITLCYKKNKNLRNQLVRANMTDEGTKEAREKGDN